MQRIEEEKRKVIVRDRDTSGARIKWVSKRHGDSVVNTLSFVNCEVPPEINAVAPLYPPRSAAPPRGSPRSFSTTSPSSRTPRSKPSRGCAAAPGVAAAGPRPTTSHRLARQPPLLLPRCSRG